MAGSGRAQLRAEPMLLSVEHLVVEHGTGASRIHAVSDVSFDLKRGETLELVGESGCGKSTLARAVLQLFRPTSGKVVFEGVDLVRESGERLRRLRRRVQLIFQDPMASLNPRRRIGDIIAEPLVIAGISDRGERESAGARCAACSGSRSRPRHAAAAARVLRWPMPADFNRPGTCARA